MAGGSAVTGSFRIGFEFDVYIEAGRDPDPATAQKRLVS
jgi:hypothetical protein